jgi:hypothetical protein
MAKADKALVARRVDELLRIRLDGAEDWDVRNYVREKQSEAGSAWFLAEGEIPLSDSQIWRYQQRADKLMMATRSHNRRQVRNRHLAQRRNLYARAVTTGEIRTALAVLRDEAEMLGLYERRPGRPASGPVETDRKKRLEQSLAFWDAALPAGAVPRGPRPDRCKVKELLAGL